jgi:hypothetical protein
MDLGTYVFHRRSEGMVWRSVKVKGGITGYHEHRIMRNARKR